MALSIGLSETTIVSNFGDYPMPPKAAEAFRTGQHDKLKAWEPKASQEIQDAWVNGRDVGFMPSDLDT